jgi:hypothetical protein
MRFTTTGFVRFTAGWYLVAVSKRTVVALLGGHYLYHCEDTQMYQISYNQKIERPSEEQRLMAAFRQVDMSRNFYFSHTYDLTSSLQANLTRPAVQSDPGGWWFSDRFAWNHHMLADAFGPAKRGEDQIGRCWVLPMIYGHVDQASES